MVLIGQNPRTDRFPASSGFRTAASSSPRLQGTTTRLSIPSVESANLSSGDYSFAKSHLASTRTASVTRSFIIQRSITFTVFYVHSSSPSPLSELGLCRVNYTRRHCVETRAHHYHYTSRDKIASMATFMTNLWESVFTPGTTPTLLLATNATFAALQTVLALLLIFAYSVHFVVLSGLCAGLWWSINWFAEELRKADQAEEEAGRLRRRRSEEQKTEHEESSDAGGESTEDGMDTEVEGAERKLRIRGGPKKIQAILESAGGLRNRPNPAQVQEGDSGATGVEIRGGPQKYAQFGFDESEQSSPSNSQQQEGKLKATHRSASNKSIGDLGETGSVSTDSEWEKVSDR
jgi:ER protein Pkr1